MVSGLLRVMEIPDRVKGHGKISPKEEALKVAYGLYECKGKRDIPLPMITQHALEKLALNMNNSQPMYYDDMVRIYDAVLLMVNEISEYDDSSVYGLIKTLEDYRNEANKQKMLSLLNLKKQKAK